MSSETLSGSLEQPLVALAAKGLELPVQFTLARYLRVLCTHGLLREATAARYIKLHDALEYGRHRFTEAEMAPVLAEILAEIEQISPQDPEFVAAAQYLARPSVDDDAKSVPPREEPSVEVAGDEGQLAWPIAHVEDYELEAETAVDEAPAVTRSTRRRVLLLLWSIAMIALGHWAPPHIGQAWQWLRFEISGPQRFSSLDEYLDRLRRRAGRHPETASIWREYEVVARRARSWEDLAVALRHQVNRQPENAQLLNRFAWFLLTTEADHLRDAREALKLAERAYVLDSAPNITDTLAEASFQTGDIERAIVLEQDALARSGTERGFYRDQLDKFIAARLDENSPP